MMKGDIKTAYYIQDAPEAIIIFARFEVVEELENSGEITNFYERTRKFGLYLSKELDFNVFTSVIPDTALQFPTSNLYVIEAMTIISKTENFQEEISNIEKSLKEAILNISSKFY
ncbi:hypothetical protein [Methanobacterium oryzae]|uniref:hypothetical protein n=1 Tax=Methanobacterium oryzae TaxID=69540 RepID=UPI003D1E8888